MFRTDRSWLHLVALTAALLGTSAAPPPAAAQATGRIPTVTRQVAEFGRLENALLDALHRRDAAGAQALLDDAFEMRVGAYPGQPVPRADWLRQALAEPAADARIEQLAVHDFGATAIASFQLSLDAAGGTPRRYFVTDAWTRSDAGWRLAVRYIGAAGDAAAAIPGAGAPPAPDPKKAG